MGKMSKTLQSDNRMSIDREAEPASVVPDRLSDKGSIKGKHLCLIVPLLSSCKVEGGIILHNKTVNYDMRLSSSLTAVWT